MQYWIYLILAIILEVAGTTSMKLADGFSRLIPSILMFVFYFSSFAALALSLKKFEVSTVYAIWSGLGTALIATMGIVCFRETISVTKVVSLTLIVAGVVGLQLSGIKH